MPVKEPDPEPGDEPGGGEAEPPTPAPDLALGAFSEHGPWVVDPVRMPWRAGLDAERVRTRAEVPRLLRPGRVPPLGRLTRVLTALGPAVGGWYVR
ncbi:MAG TPA: AarF/ABC1/UbiB kinase family protein, partial [Acidimicrobiia bacterium]